VRNASHHRQKEESSEGLVPTFAIDADRRQKCVEVTFAPVTRVQEEEGGKRPVTRDREEGGKDPCLPFICLRDPVAGHRRPRQNESRSRLLLLHLAMFYTNNCAALMNGLYGESNHDETTCD
jgi:hypothetical protein